MVVKLTGFTSDDGNHHKNFFFSPEVIWRPNWYSFVGSRLWIWRWRRNRILLESHTTEMHTWIFMDVVKPRNFQETGIE